MGKHNRKQIWRFILALWFGMMFLIGESQTTYAKGTLTLLDREYDDDFFEVELASTEKIKEITDVRLTRTKDADGNSVQEVKYINDDVLIYEISSKKHGIFYEPSKEGEYLLEVFFKVKGKSGEQVATADITYFKNCQLFYQQEIDINGVMYNNFYKLPDAVNTEQNTLYYNTDSVKIDVIAVGVNSPIQNLNLTWGGKNIATRTLELESNQDIYKVDYPTIGHFTISEEGSGELSANASNETGSYESKNIGKTIVIDRTKPVIAFDKKYANAKEKVYTNKVISVPITITEKNFDVASTNVKLDGKEIKVNWSGSDTQQTTKVKISEEGEHTITVTCTDKAKNEAKQITSATIVYDETAPTVKITGVANGVSYGNDNQKYPISIVVQDTYLKNKAVTAKIIKIDEKNGASLSEISGLEKSEQEQKVQFDIADIKDDGYYKIQVVATDLSGNSLNKKSLDKTGNFAVKNSEVIGYFYINRNGSVFKLDEATQKMYNQEFHTSESITDIIIYEYNINEIKDASVKLLTTTGEKDAQFVWAEVTSSFATELAKEEYKNYNHVYQYKISKDNFIVSGSYSLKISSSTNLENLDGNTTLKIESNDEELMNRKIIVDNEKPKLIVFRCMNQELRIQIRDNYLNDETLVVKVNDKEYKLKKDDYDSTSTNLVYAYSFKKDDEITQDDEIVVTCEDRAGNVFSTVEDKNAPEAEFAPEEDRTTMYGLIALGATALLILLVAILVSRLVRRKRY